MRVLHELLLLLPIFAPQTMAGEEDTAIAYLAKYGYLASHSPGGTQASPILAGGELEEAVRDLQRFAGIRVTGKIDGATLEVLGRPRCGVSDRRSSTNGNYSIAKSPSSSSPLLSAEYRLEGSRWKKKSVSYRVTGYSSKINRAVVNREVARAFTYWSQAADISFIAAISGSSADIDISFVTYSHGDGDPFDGPGGTLAHAYYPQWGGDVHMDDTEAWTSQEHRGTNFLAVLTHEIGHSLGLDHSSAQGAVMAPFSTPYDPQFALSQDDIRAIQSLYGKPRSHTTTPRPGTKPGIPSFQCPDVGSNTGVREGAEVLDGIQSWSDCSIKCNRRPGCRYWTWHHGEAGDYSYRCVTMSDLQHKVPDTNAISGSSQCLCPHLKTNLQGRGGSSVVGKMTSWRQCGERCTEDQRCKYWVWHPPGDHEASQRCVIMASYTNSASDDLAVAGAKYCH